MSTVEEDVELRDLVAQTLEKNGCLAKLRAELRASIFLALDEDIKLSKQEPLKNLRIQSYLETPEGRAMFWLVREFLDFFNLQFTISVYEPESYFESIGQYEGRQKIAKDLGLDHTEEPTVPLLQQLLKIAQAKSKILDINLNVNSNINGSFIDESLNNDSSYKKTETFNSLSQTNSNNDTKLESDANKSEPVVNVEYLNNTFDLNSPTVNLNKLKKASEEIKNILKDVIREEDTLEDKSSLIEDNRPLDNSNHSLSNPNSESKSTKNQNLSGEKNGSADDAKSPRLKTAHIIQTNIENERNSDLSKRALKEDDTYEDTSSIAEDSEALTHTNSPKAIVKTDVPFISSTHSKINEVDVPLGTSSTKADLDKPKLSPQRPKTSLSSLSDLPPLQVNKTRASSDILPSLYNKEFKNKSNLKELDKMFDMDAEYEEDFIFSSNELSINVPAVKSTLVDEPGVVNKMDSEKLNIINKKEPKVSSKGISDMGKSVFRPTVPKTCSNLLKTSEHSNGSLSEHSLSD